MLHRLYLKRASVMFYLRSLFKDIVVPLVLFSVLLFLLSIVKCCSALHLQHGDARRFSLQNVHVQSSTKQTFGSVSRRSHCGEFPWIEEAIGNLKRKTRFAQHQRTKCQAFSTRHLFACCLFDSGSKSHCFVGAVDSSAVGGTALYPKFSQHAMDQLPWTAVVWIAAKVLF